MTTLAEQISSTSRAQFLAQLEFFNQLAANAMDNARNLAGMQLEAAREGFVRGSEAWRQLLTARDASAWLDTGADMQRNFDRLFDSMRGWMGGAYMKVPAAPAHEEHAAPAAQPYEAAPAERVPEPQAPLTALAEAVSEVAPPAAPSIEAAPIPAEPEVQLPRVQPQEPENPSRKGSSRK
ncbi:MAG: hypothetical protein ACXU8N_12860 [Telluria sp.]